jgi:hypothetical protein
MGRVVLTLALVVSLAFTTAATAGGDTAPPRIKRATATAFQPAAGLYTTFIVNVRVCDQSRRLRVNVNELWNPPNDGTEQYQYSNARKTVYGSGCHDVSVIKRSRKPFVTGGQYRLTTIVRDAAGNSTFKNVRLHFYSD